MEMNDVESMKYKIFSTKETEPWNFSWVVKSEICACAWPQSFGNLTFLKNQDVGYIVSLSKERQPPPSKNFNIRCYLIDVEEFEAPSIKQIMEFISVCEIARKEQKAVCVHCRMGRGRTGVMLASYLVKYYNQIPSRAITNVRLMRPGSVETWEQERVVKDFWDYLAWNT